MTIAPLDPIYQAQVAHLTGTMNLASLSLDDVRTYIDQQYPAIPSTVADQVAPIEEKAIPTTAENGTGTVTLVISRPKGSENDILPVVIYMHGGGWTFGARTSSKKFLNDLVVRAHVAVVYIAFTLSPQVKYPVAIEECYSSILWVHQNAASLHVDPKRLMVMGDSAGALTATVESILLKQRGHGDVVNGQILLYPAVAHIRSHYESFKDYINANYTISMEDMEHIEWLHYGDKYKTQGPDGHWLRAPAHLMAGPLLATDDDLMGLPRCLIITAECDIIRDEGEEYARCLTKVGVDTSAVRMIGAIHGFMTMPVAETSQYRTSLQLINTFVNQCM